MIRALIESTRKQNLSGLLETTFKFGQVLVVTLSIAGCVTTEEVMKQHQAKCVGYGLRPGTPQFTTCMMQLDKQAQRESECSAAYWGAFSTAPPEKGAGYGFGVAAQAKANCMAGLPVQPPPPARPSSSPPSNASCTAAGNSLNCVLF